MSFYAIARPREDFSAFINDDLYHDLILVITTDCIGKIIDPPRSFMKLRKALHKLFFLPWSAFISQNKGIWIAS